MSRDANQIAREFERRQPSVGTSSRFVGDQSHSAEPQRGELTVFTSLGAAAEVISTHKDVTVQFTAAGLVIATYPDGGKIAFQPIPGWSIMFEPGNEGE